MQSISQEKTDNFVLLNRVQFFPHVIFDFFPLCNKDVQKIWLLFGQENLTREEVRKQKTYVEI